MERERNKKCRKYWGQLFEGGYGRNTHEFMDSSGMEGKVQFVLEIQGWR